jgi:tRNA(Ile)-lysidine synthase TilS/MesJ
MNNRHIYNIKKRIQRTIGKQGLLKENDKVLIALSGGKDSLILLESLAECKKHLPFKVDFYACHVLIENIGYETDIEYLSKYCQLNGVKFILKKFKIELDSNTKKSVCFICSWNRRRTLFELTKELGCNKLAFGHHMDDALQTLFMNMVYHGSISSLPYSFNMFENRIEVIRPLLDIAEEDLLKYAEDKGYISEIKKCIYENSKRKEIGNLINEIAARHNVAKKNMFRSMSNIYQDYLPQWKK